jgi:hypothetical protein
VAEGKEREAAGGRCRRRSGLGKEGRRKKGGRAGDIYALALRYQVKMRPGT